MDNLQLDTLVITCDRKSELPSVAQQILTFAADSRVMLFVGDLGAGKTTLIKELCMQLGVKDETASPTFSIINEYAGDASNSIYHFDFYRIKNEDEALNLGVEEYFYSGNYCFIEWPERIERLLPDNFLIIKIKGNEGEKRTFNLTRYE